MSEGEDGLPQEGRRRAVVEALEPRIDGGRFPAKRIVGDDVVVEADAFVDGHDELSCVVRFRHEEEDRWREVPMEPLGSDRWRASFRATLLGRYRFTVVAWVDRFETWRRDLEKRLDAGQDVSQELRTGARLVDAAAARAEGPDRASLERWARALRHLSRAPGNGSDEPGAVPGSIPSTDDDPRDPPSPPDDAGPYQTARRALSPYLSELMALYPDRSLATRGSELQVVVDRARARFSAWYELFPRSTATDPGRHGTFADVIDVLPYVREMGFDVLYLPPIHPIGRTKRKGPNNAPEAGPDDPGSPWGIGAEEGGHKSVHPQLGTMDDFRELRKAAADMGLELALDVAFQCSPDHPYVEEHPEWFRTRPDGSIQYAENPPKKYEDIYPFDFETEDWEGLWQELKSVFDFWIDEGVRIFRVDNPHTKPFDFWEWCIGRIKNEHPDVLFLSEAFTRPKVMYRLAKLGFTQSYTYFAWRNDKEELREYARELTTTKVREFFRPNFWPNTPDILTEYLQTGGRGAFMARLVLAATLSSSYGIYGPAYELQEHVPREPGSEEYLHSEKYEIRDWNLDRADSLRDFVGRINRIRRENPALQRTSNVRFHATDDDGLVAYSKASTDGSNVILVVVNLDPHDARAGWVDLDLDALGLPPDEEFTVNDLLGGEHFLWKGARNYVELDPAVVPAHVFHVSRPVPSESEKDPDDHV